MTYTFGKVKTFFFSLCLIPPETGDVWVLNSLIKVQKRLSPDVHKNLRVYWGAQTHIDEEINNRLVDLENAVLLLGEEVQNLKLQIHLKCDWSITTFCVTPPGILTNLNTPGKRLDSTFRAIQLTTLL